VFVEPLEAMVPPVAKMVTFGRLEFMGVWMSCRVIRGWERISKDLMGEASADAVRSDSVLNVDNILEGLWKMFDVD
jgi:hypothetical protein